MATREQKIRVGLFFLIGVVLIAALFLFAMGRTLFEEKKTYYIKFRDTSVSGLGVGSNVKYHGIAVGEIKDISVSGEDIGDVVVTIAVDEDTPIKENMKANLAMMGITGSKQIELSGGTNQAKDLPEGSTIEAGSSALADITGDAQIIADKAELLLNNLNNFASTANQDAFSDILANINYLLDTNSDKISQTLDNAQEITHDLNYASEDIRETSLELRELVEREEIDRIIENLLSVTEASELLVGDLRSSVRPEKLDEITDNITEFTDMMKGDETRGLLEDTSDILVELRKILEQTDETSQVVDMTVLRSSRDLVEAIRTLGETMKNLNEFSRIISEDPSRLIEF
ncbi:MAG: MlaD family protein [Spirochaetaceae bacterium]